MRSEEASSSLKRKREDAAAEGCERKKLMVEKSGLQCHLSSLNTLLVSAHELVSKGVASKDMHRVERWNWVM